MRSKNCSISRSSSEKMPAVRPYSVRFASSIASSSVITSPTTRDRHEQLLGEQRMVARQAVDDRRLDEVAVGEARRRSGAGRRSRIVPPSCLRLRDGALVGLDRLLVDDRPEVDVAIRADCRS